MLGLLEVALGDAHMCKAYSTATARAAKAVEKKGVGHTWAVGCATPIPSDALPVLPALLCRMTSERLLRGRHLPDAARREAGASHTRSHFMSSPLVAR